MGYYLSKKARDKKKLLFLLENKDEPLKKNGAIKINIIRFIDCYIKSFDEIKKYIDNHYAELKLNVSELLNSLVDKNFLLINDNFTRASVKTNNEIEFRKYESQLVSRLLQLQINKIFRGKRIEAARFLAETLDKETPVYSLYLKKYIEYKNLLGSTSLLNFNKISPQIEVHVDRLLRIIHGLGIEKDSVIGKEILKEIRKKCIVEFEFPPKELPKKIVVPQTRTDIVYVKTSDESKLTELGWWGGQREFILNSFIKQEDNTEIFIPSEKNIKELKDRYIKEIKSRISVNDIKDIFKFLVDNNYVDEVDAKDIKLDTKTEEE